MESGAASTPSSPSRDERRRRRKRRARRRLLLLVLVLAAVAAAVVVAVAALGGGDAPAGGGDAAAAAAATAEPVTPPPEVWVASAADPVRVWVGGDSMGGELGFSLEPLLAESGSFKPMTFYKVSSGICRYDFFDWQKRIEQVSGKDRPDAAVVMMGTNDTQSVWRDGDWVPYGQTAWKQAYEERVGAIIDTLLDGGTRRVYWVGMPVMGEDWRNPRMRLINRIFEKQAGKRPGAEYVDIWDLYTAADGTFDPSLRLGDGVHFTVEGQRLLAERVLKAIEADWRPPGSEAPGGSPQASSPAP